MLVAGPDGRPRRATASRPGRSRQARAGREVSPRGRARLTRLAPARLCAGEGRLRRLCPPLADVSRPGSGTGGLGPGRVRWRVAARRGAGELFDSRYTGVKQLGQPPGCVPRPSRPPSRSRRSARSYAASRPAGGVDPRHDLAHAERDLVALQRRAEPAHQPQRLAVVGQHRAREAGDALLGGALGEQVASGAGRGRGPATGHRRRPPRRRRRGPTRTQRATATS